MISDSYRELNRKLHESNEHYGVSGQKYVEAVKQLCNQLQTTDVLDYGCGKRTLETALGFAIKNYDPAIAGVEKRPEPAAVVACTDVLEHLEPDTVDAVLADLRHLTQRVAFVTIATRPAMKFLADGRNAHLIQEGPHWWLPRIWAAGFALVQFNDLGGEFALVLR